MHVLLEPEHRGAREDRRRPRRVPHDRGGSSSLTAPPPLSRYAIRPANTAPASATAVEKNIHSHIS